MLPRFLYLHGFASGPQSTKAVAFAEHYARRDVAVERLDLRVPSLEHLRLSAMIETVQEAIGGATDRAVVFGSSLGGLTAARVAERDPRVGALVLLAPAFRLAERWRELADWDDWQRTGWHAIHDYATRQPARVDFGFYEDVVAIDQPAQRGPDAGPASDGYPDVRVPTLILHGVHDEVVPIDRARAFARGKPHVQLIELDDGHELIASLPRLLDEADRFLAPWLGGSPNG